MKRKAIFWVILVLALLITACGGAATPAQPTKVQAQPTTANAEPYPEPETEIGAMTETGAYPAPEGEPEQVEWERAQNAILTGLVYRITQRQNMEVVVVLKDGRQFLATAPSLDEVAAAVTKCGKACTAIEIINE